MIGMPELVVIGLLVMMLFGAGRLPQVMKQLGEGIRDFRHGVTDPNTDDD